MSYAGLATALKSYKILYYPVGTRIRTCVGT